MKREQDIYRSEEVDKAARHCMVVHAYYPLGETRVERQALALVDRGTEVDVICLRRSDEADLEVVDAVRVHRLPIRRRKSGGLVVQLFEYLSFFILAFVRLTRLHLKNHFDVVQVHNLPDFLVFTALIPKLMGAKIILDLHDLMPEFYAERFEGTLESLPVRIIRWQEWLSCRYADHIITVTELWREALIDRGQPPDKVSVAMNTADDRVFHLGVVPGISTDRDGLHLIYHGAMGYRHGLDLALRAIDLVRRSVPDVQLTLHGGGEYRRALENLADELGLQEHVQFSNVFVPTEQLASLIKAQDLGIVPNRDGAFTGGILPTKLMEYAALGIPSIAAHTPTIAAYFDDSMVEFFEPGDFEGLAGCILKLYHDRTRLAQLRQNITRFNEQYNWPDQSASYCRLVESLIRR